MKKLKTIRVSPIMTKEKDYFQLFSQSSELNYNNHSSCYIKEISSLLQGETENTQKHLRNAKITMINLSLGKKIRRFLKKKTV